jgi:carbamoyl-phosphate synthase small subunit
MSAQSFAIQTEKKFISGDAALEEEKYMNPFLLLEDGTRFDGISLGIKEERYGPVIMNTGVVGYQEIITDPANAGKIVVFTYPLIGNYGINRAFNESARAWISGLIIKESSRIYSNWQAKGSLEDFLMQEKLVALSAVDTRTLAVRIRDHGEMWGALSQGKTSEKEVLKKIAAAKSEKRSYAKEISVKQLTTIASPSSSHPLQIALIDLGTTQSLLRQLALMNCEVTLFPFNSPPDQVMAMKPDGIVISGGPEDDPAVEQVSKTLKELLGKVPLFGTSAGHEAIALALGGRLKRLAVGHHGVNYPVMKPGSLKGEITVQNHSFVVDEESVKEVKDLKIEERNLNDHTIEKMRSDTRKFISIQYYPASPGCNEVHPVLREFLTLLQ